MKNLLKVSLAFMLLATFLVSCDKEIETTPLDLGSYATATIKGYVHAELDLTKYGDEPVAKKKVIITMAYSELTSSATGNLIDTVVTDDNGFFSYEVPSTPNGVDVSVKVAEFTYPQKQEFDNTQHATIEKAYTASTVTYSVKASDIQYKDIELTAGTIIGAEPVYWHTVSGVLTANTDETSGAEETIPQNTPITFSTSGWSTTINVGANGTYSVSVPDDENIYYTFDFTVNGKVGAGTSAIWIFEGTKIYLGTYYADEEDEDLSLELYKTQQ
jgi:hypothetical protein